MPDKKEDLEELRAEVRKSLDNLMKYMTEDKDIHAILDEDQSELLNTAWARRMYDEMVRDFFLKYLCNN